MENEWNWLRDRHGICNDRHLDYRIIELRGNRNFAVRTLVVDLGGGGSEGEGCV